MYDPIPWLLRTDEELRAHGLKRRGWYMIGQHRDPPIGPFDSPEECIMAMADLAKRPNPVGHESQDRPKRSG